MDMGAGVCTVRAPRCLLCPIAAHCRARAGGNPEAYPVKAPKRAKPQRRGTAFWIERNGAVWLVRRPAKGMLGAMRALPDDGWSARADGHGQPPIAAQWQPLGSVRHGFTHFDLELQLMRADGHDTSAREGGEWWPIDRLAEAGLPTLYARAARLALANNDLGDEKP
jgi:A/G-specific adenine glycosylase